MQMHNAARHVRRTRKECRTRDGADLSQGPPWAAARTGCEGQEALDLQMHIYCANSIGIFKQLLS